MANMTAKRNNSRDGWLIRLSIICFFALIVLVYFLQSGDIFSASSNARFASPQMLVVPTIEPTVPDLDDVIIFQGEAVMRRLDKGGIQNWTFNGTEGSFVDLALMPMASAPEAERLAGDETPIAQVDPGFDPVLELFAPSGGLLIKSDEYGADQPEFLRGIELPESGEYTVWITDETFEHGASYTLTFNPYFVKATHPQRIGVGEALRGKLDVNQFQMWVFSAETNQEISITALPIRTHDDAFRPRVDLYSPTGELLTSFNGVERSITMPATGNYTLWVMDDGFDDEGEYMLSVQASDAKAEINRRP